MGGAIRLKRSNSGSISTLDKSIDEEDEDEYENSQSPESKRRKSTVWESSPKRSTSRKSSIILPASSASAPSAAAPSNNNPSLNESSRTRGISSERSSTSSIRSLGSNEHSKEGATPSSSSSDGRLALNKPWSLEDFTLGKALGKVIRILTIGILSTVPFCFVLFYCVLLYLHCSALLCSILTVPFCSVLYVLVSVFRSLLFCSILNVLFCSIPKFPFCCVLLCSVLFYSPTVSFHSSLLCSILFFLVLLSLVQFCSIVSVEGKER